MESNIKAVLLSEEQFAAYAKEIRPVADLLCVMYDRMSGKASKDELAKSVSAIVRGLPRSFSGLYRATFPEGHELTVRLKRRK